MARHSLILGVNNYGEESGLKDLKYAVRDAERLGAIMASPDYGGAPETTTVRTNVGFAEATDTVFDFLDELGPDDQAFLHFSGHGMLDDAGNLYLCFADTVCERLLVSALPANKIDLIMKNCKASQAIISLDCCYAAAGSDLASRDSIYEEVKAVGASISRTRGTAFLAAAGETEAAKESDELQAGVFTHHLIQGIESGVADHDGDGNITVYEIARYLRETVPGHAKLQDPHLATSGHADQMVIAESRQIQMRQMADVARGKLRKSYAENVLDLSLAHDVEVFIDRDNLRPLHDTPKWHLIEQLIKGELTIGDFNTNWRTVAAEEQVQAKARQEAVAQQRQLAEAEADRRDRAQRRSRFFKVCAMVLLAFLSGGLASQFGIFDRLGL